MFKTLTDALFTATGQRAWDADTNWTRTDRGPFPDCKQLLREQMRLQEARRRGEIR